MRHIKEAKAHIERAVEPTKKKTVASLWPLPILQVIYE
jgi:hypothetical protein